ncbi:hypothetical protein FOTG_17776 [Fusarium oxysporum f. sp. vasinfectum 25433]|uniref:Uncharacterized protein n=1 Tax=Fusarium oxysporum f. sp. vasinfectum 25433 TaxID=1089449 RepID=X0KJJ8_FUSOX|nr:hypothetical protein FOTG_17776 [Fusarium oxysporum f. sp. vasinfectum 25433]
MIQAVQHSRNASTSDFVMPALLAFIEVLFRICLPFLRAMVLRLCSATHREILFVIASLLGILMTQKSMKKALILLICHRISRSPSCRLFLLLYPASRPIFLPLITES